jgi:hypothetical protein
MNIDKIITSVDVEKLYTHVLATEGVKHPLKAPEALEQAEEYILKEFEKYGLNTNVQEFQLEGMDQSFRNIEGFIGNGKDPELLIIAHHDTQPNTPGADDNASAIAVMLETARILQQAEWSGSARFISFTLEEAHPGRYYQEKKLEREYGIIDEEHRYTSWRLSQLWKQFNIKVREIFYSGTDLLEASEKATALIQKELSKTELECLAKTAKVYEDLTITNPPGKAISIGSSYWVDEALRLKKPVKGVLCYDCVSYTSKTPNSQQVDESIPPNLFKTHETQDLTIGDYIWILGDRNSAELANSFCSNAQRRNINLPYACLQGDFTYEQVAQTMGGLLIADHAPFWRAGIPALLITDSGSGRNPHYHRPSDTINTLDFDFMTKICQATIATTIELASSQ